MTPYFLIMPSQRKRIGFLPSEDVHNIIEKICRTSNYSQSKVTGILVEEALRSRGLVESSIDNKNDYRKYDVGTYEKNLNCFSKSETSRDIELMKFNNQNISDEIDMINDYIEYKMFKSVMNQKKNMLG